MSSTTFQIMSDLHLETHISYESFQLDQSAANLALLGDIGHIADEKFFVWLEGRLRDYNIVYFLLGNHEPWHLSWNVAKAKVTTFAKKYRGRFIFLDQTRHDLTKTVTILGCTLFSYITPKQDFPVESRLVDFKDILRWEVDDHNAAHQSDLKWLNEQVAQIQRDEPERRIVIFTHHCPTTDARASNQYFGESEVSSAFATDLSNELCWKAPAVKMWAYGHTHWNCDFSDEYGKRILANQKGYKLSPKDTFKMTATYRLGE